MDSFEKLANALRRAGFVGDALFIDSVHREAHTTSSELYGALGEIVTKVFSNITEEARTSLRAEFEACEQDVQAVWPDYRTDTGFPGA